MKHKTSDLEGALLDAAVARCLGHAPYFGRSHREHSNEPPSLCWHDSDSWPTARYSSDWGVAGPITQRERIVPVYGERWTEGPGWHAYDYECFEHVHTAPLGAGPTPLISAMRAYVRSRLGDEVELP